MRRNIIYTIGRPEAELASIRSLIAAASGLEASTIGLFALSEGNDFGRIYYAAVEPETERGLVFTIARRQDPTAKELPQALSEWEVKDLFKLARKLSHHQFRMLAPLRLFEDQIVRTYEDM